MGEVRSEATIPLRPNWREVCRAIFFAPPFFVSIALFLAGPFLISLLSYLFFKTLLFDRHAILIWVVTIASGAATIVGIVMTFQGIIRFKKHRERREFARHGWGACLILAGLQVMVPAGIVLGLWNMMLQPIAFKQKHGGEPVYTTDQQLHFVLKDAEDHGIFIWMIDDLRRK